MQTALQNIHTWLLSIPRIWKKPENPSDFVWLARFRLLALYIMLKSALLLLVGVVGLRIQSIRSLFFRLRFTPLDNSLTEYLCIQLVTSAGILFSEQT